MNIEVEMYGDPQRGETKAATGDEVVAVDDLTGKQAEIMSEVIERSQGWQPGDPCGVCGSTNTIWDDDPTVGARCLSCGACDDDE